MSDRVATIGGFGQDQDGVVGVEDGAGTQVIGRDHFPWPVVDYVTDTNLLFPISVSLNDMMSMAWRVRRWRVHGELTRDDGFNPPVLVDIDWIATIGDDIDREVGEQSSLINREAKLVGYTAMNSGDDLNSDTGSIYQVGLFVGPSFAQFEDPNFRPGFFVRIYDGSELGIVIDTRLEPFVSSPIATDARAQLVVNENEYNATFYVNPADTLDHITGTLIVEPSEYWPYATKSGDPVYDALSGAIINDPFS